jgi:hypothetical protein
VRTVCPFTMRAAGMVSGALPSSMAGLSGTATFALTNSSFSPCDADQDGKVNVADVQRLINEALGAASPANDENADGRVNVVDVEIVINAAARVGVCIGCIGRCGGNAGESPPCWAASRRDCVCGLARISHKLRSMWRRHSCLLCRDSSRHSAVWQNLSTNGASARVPTPQAGCLRHVPAPGHCETCGLARPGASKNIVHRRDAEKGKFKVKIGER